MKASVCRRKLANRARTGPRPARLFRVAPTFSNHDVAVVGRCGKQVGETRLSRRRWLRGKRRTVNVVCGGDIVVTRGRRGRKMFCAACRERRAEQRKAARQPNRPWLAQPTSSRPSLLARVSPFHRRTHA